MEDEDEVKVSFNLKCLIFGHIWLGCNGSTYEFCDRCFKERGVINGNKKDS